MRKQAITLMEVMVVIVLVGMISGVLAVNMKGSIRKGKIFQTEQQCMRVQEVLMMEYATSGLSLDQIVEDRAAILKNSLLMPQGKDPLKDAWGDDLIVRISREGDAIEVTSKLLDRYGKK